MQVLITESAQGAATAAARRLQAAGHELAFCHQSEDGGAICAVLAQGGRCPLDRGRIDVVVVGRDTPGPLTMREIGGMCAIRNRVPLVLCGPAPAEIPPGLACSSCGPDTVVEACERAAGPECSAYGAADAAVRHALGYQPGERGIAVRLMVTAGIPQVHVALPWEPGAQVRRLVQEAVRAALARYDPPGGTVLVFFDFLAADGTQSSRSS